MGKRMWGGGPNRHQNENYHTEVETKIRVKPVVAKGRDASDSKHLRFGRTEGMVIKVSMNALTIMQES